MSANLKRLQIDSVEESVEYPSAYLKRVEIVEVVDQDGNPWEPVPGPDPWDDLVVADKALLHESNIYESGETVYATTATYVGGDAAQTTYKWRWQWRQDPNGTWANSPWTTYNNTLTQASYTIPGPGQVRFQCQAKDDSQDPVVSVNSFTSSKTVPYPPLVVGPSTLTGSPYVGETITASQPTVTGGKAPYTYNYMWLDSSTKTPVNHTVLGAFDEGKMVSAYVTVTDAEGTQEHVTSNTVGPVEFYTIGTLSVVNTDTNTPINNNDIEALLRGVTAHYTASYTGNLPADKAGWQWSIRSGGSTISGPTGNASVTIDVVNEFPGVSTPSIAINSFASEDAPSLSWTISTTE